MYPCANLCPGSAATPAFACQNCRSKRPSAFPVSFTLGLLTLLLSSLATFAGEVFVEAESFDSSGGWTVVGEPKASGLAVLSGAAGDKNGVATKTVSIKDAGHYRIWVRYATNPTARDATGLGPFHVTALSGERVLGDGLFDAEYSSSATSDPWMWRSFDAVLPPQQA
jgi:hypothetical protein